MRGACGPREAEAVAVSVAPSVAVSVARAASTALLSCLGIGPPLTRLAASGWRPCQGRLPCRRPRSPLRSCRQPTRRSRQAGTPCPFAMLHVLACLPQPRRRRPPQLVCSWRGCGYGWQGALQVRSRGRSCICKTYLRGRHRPAGINVVQGVFKCASTYSGWRSDSLCKRSRTSRRSCRQPCHCCRLEPRQQPPSEQAPKAPGAWSAPRAWAPNREGSAADDFVPLRTRDPNGE